MPKRNIKQREGMVDISGKEMTKRTAAASCEVRMSAQTFETLMKEGSPKGNVFETARVAGVMAAKSTASLIPLCHPLQLSKVKVSFAPDQNKKIVAVLSEVICLGRTGVEMEALTAVTAAALTIYDMMKWADKGMTISEIKLLSKTGGKSGDFKRG